MKYEEGSGFELKEIFPLFGLLIFLTYNFIINFPGFNDLYGKTGLLFNLVTIAVFLIGLMSVVVALFISLKKLLVKQWQSWLVLAYLILVAAVLWVMRFYFLFLLLAIAFFKDHTLLY